MLKKAILFLRDYIARSNEFNVKLFKILGLGGIAVSILTCIYSLFEISYVSSITCLIAAILAAFLLYYVEKTEKYVFGYIVTEIGVFMTLFTILFFCGGGMEGSLPYFFAFSMIFTFLMFQNKLLIAMEALLALVYLIDCYVAFYIPKSLVTELSQEALFYEKLVGIFLSALSMGLIILAYINEFKKQKKIADDANAAKSTFLANMSHEIRTPINSIIGFNEIMMRQTGEDQTREYALLVNKAGKQLLTVINQVLDFSRLDSGKETLFTEEYNLEDMVNEVFKVATLGCQKKNLKATLEYDQTLNHTFIGDREKLSRVLTNLLSNAVKYTKKGAVILKAVAKENITQEGSGETYQKIRFEVEDTGIGIKKEDMDKLFHSYERIDLLTNQKIQGTGLGLAISKELVSLLGGEIQVESEYGKGSKFSFEILQKTGSDKVISKGNFLEGKKHFVAPDVNILVVDDNHMNRTLIKEILKGTLAQIDTATTAMECLEMRRQKDYDIILMDYMMPQMDGAQAMEIIREEEKALEKHTPIIVLTADVVEEIDKKLIARGFDSYLSKPIDADKLENEIMKYLSPEDITITESMEDEQISESEIVSIGEFLNGYDIDIMEGLRYVNQSLSHYTNIVRFFVNHSDKSREVIAKAMEETDMERLRLSFHSLKGNARNVGAVDLYEISRKLEQKAKKEDMEYLRCSVDALYLEWDRALEGFCIFLKNEGPTEKEDNAMPQKGMDELICDLIHELTLCKMKPAKTIAEKICSSIKEEKDKEMLYHSISLIEEMEFEQAEDCVRRFAKDYGIEI